MHLPRHRQMNIFKSSTVCEIWTSAQLAVCMERCLYLNNEAAHYDQPRRWNASLPPAKQTLVNSPAVFFPFWFTLHLLFRPIYFQLFVHALAIQWGRTTPPTIQIMVRPAGHERAVNNNSLSTVFISGQGILGRQYSVRATCLLDWRCLGFQT